MGGARRVESMQPLTDHGENVQSVKARDLSVGRPYQSRAEVGGGAGPASTLHEGVPVGGTRRRRRGIAQLSHWAQGGGRPEVSPKFEALDDDGDEQTGV